MLKPWQDWCIEKKCMVHVTSNYTRFATSNHDLSCQRWWSVRFRLITRQAIWNVPFRSQESKISGWAIQIKRVMLDVSVGVFCSDTLLQITRTTVLHVRYEVGRRPCIKPSGVLDCMHGCYILIWSHVANRHSNCDNGMNRIIRCIHQHVSANQLTRKSSNMSIPIRSLGLVFFTTHLPQNQPFM